MAKGKTPPDKPKSPKSGTGVGRNGNLHPKPWKKGDPSPNPSGRPKGLKNRATILTDLLALTFKKKDEETGKLITVPNPLDPSNPTMTVEIAVEVALIKKALSGNIEAIKEIKDTLHGKIKEVREIIPPDLSRKEIEDMTEEEAQQIYDSKLRGAE